MQHEGVTMATLFEAAAIDHTIHLSIEQTVPRSLVHKRSLENVLLTEIRACGNDRFICAGRLPTVHRFFNEAGRTPREDILFYTELGRQASLAVSHAFLDVASEDIFIFEGSEAALTDAAWSGSSESAHDLVAIEIRIREMTRRRNNAVNRVVAEHLMFIGGAPVFHGTGAWTVQPAALYQRLRRSSALRSAVTDAAIGEGRVERRRRAAENVVIAPSAYEGTSAPFTATLLVDDNHPYFFDHPCDHVPGMLLLEGCAQAALAAFTGATGVPRWSAAVRAYEVNFAQFVERGLPIALTAQPAPENGEGHRPPAVRVEISQQGVVAGTATMHVASPIGA
jgi:3-hydroxymyristoyl/3-hydroxydecanoyl-(acyl carrier protein) dehydratase